MYQNRLGPSGGIYYPNFVPCFVVHQLNKYLLIRYQYIQKVNKQTLTDFIFSVKNLQKGQDCQTEPNNSTFVGSLISKDVETKDINGNFKDSGVKLTESEQSNSKNEQN